MEPEILPIRQGHDVPPNLPLSSSVPPPLSSRIPDSSSSSSSSPHQQQTTASCSSNLPSASPSSQQPHVDTPPLEASPGPPPPLPLAAPPDTPPPLPPEDRLQMSWNSEQLDRTSQSSSPLTAARSTDPLLVGGDSDSPCGAPVGSSETVDSNVDKIEDCTSSSGHASLSSDDMSRTTSPHTLESGGYSLDSSRSSSYRSYDSPSHKAYSKQSSSRPLAQYMDKSQPSESLYERRNGSFKSKRERQKEQRQRERHHSESGSSHSDDRLYKKDSQPCDTGYQREFWQKPGTQSPESASTGSGSPRTESPRTGSPSVGNGKPSSPHPQPMQLDRNGYPVHNRTVSENDPDTMPGRV